VDGGSGGCARRRFGQLAAQANGAGGRGVQGGRCAYQRRGGAGAAGILAGDGTRVDWRLSNVATELRWSIGDGEQAYRFGSSLRFPWTRRLATGTPLAGASASEPAAGLAGRRRSASSRRRHTAAGQGAGTRAPQGRVRTALKGAGRMVPLARTPRKSAAAPWPCPPWTLATAGIQARMGSARARAGAGLKLAGGPGQAGLQFGPSWAAA
jgi:hypothetical protein